MYELIYNVITNNTNYKYLNTNNIYNCLINIYESIIEEENKDKFKNIIKLNIGLSFYNDLEIYYIKKFNKKF